MTEPLPPGLYIVATPIGNLGDLSPRASDVLNRCALVLAEDKRVSARLLDRSGERTPMRTYNDHSGEDERAAIVARLGGEAIALVSDAGTPLISDPGFKLVREARAAGHLVVTVPGPCAAIAALTLAGLPTDRFLFLGFLPSKEKARSEVIEEVAAVRATLVLYESGPRLAATLLALHDTLGGREAAVARELTKVHEECVTGSLEALAARYADAAPRGEIVIVVAPPPPPQPAGDAELDGALGEAMATLSASRAAAAVAERLRLPRKRVYARALELDGRSDPE